MAVEQYGAGPFGSLHLADLGAEIIKIEDPRFGGDVGRYIPPFQEGEDSLFFETFNRNKKSLSLNLSIPEGRRVFEDLVAKSDAVFSNLRGDVPAKLRIRYDDLAEINPRIVCVSVSGFGMTGPLSTEPGYDYILQGLAGWMSLTGEPEGPPTKTGISLVDYSGGYVAAIALLAGVHAARRDGKGMDCDISLYDVAVSLLTYPANLASQPRVATRPHHSLRPSVPGPFPAVQGKRRQLVPGGVCQGEVLRPGSGDGRQARAGRPSGLRDLCRPEGAPGRPDRHPRRAVRQATGRLLDRPPEGGRRSDRAYTGRAGRVEPPAYRRPEADRGDLS